MRRLFNFMLAVGVVISFFLGSAWVVRKQQSAPEYLAKNHYSEIIEISKYPRFCERGEEKIIRLGQKFNAELKRGKLSYEDIGITESDWKTSVQKAWANTYAYYVDKASHASTEEKRGDYFKKALVSYLRAQQWARDENQNFTEDTIPRLVDEGPGGEAEIDPKVAEAVLRLLGGKADLENPQEESTFQSGNLVVSGYVGYLELKLFSGSGDELSESLLPMLSFCWSGTKSDGNYTYCLEDTRLTGVAGLAFKDETRKRNAGDLDIQKLYQSALGAFLKS